MDTSALEQQITREANLTKIKGIFTTLIHQRSTLGIGTKLPTNVMHEYAAGILQWFEGDNVTRIVLIDKINEIVTRYEHTGE